MTVDIRDISSRKGEDKKRLVLIVDDNRIIRKLLENILRLEDYETSSVTNGREALDFLKNCQPDLILLDIDMPVMDGYQTCKEIRGRKEYETIPIIMVTAVSDKDIVKKVLSLGANDYIGKPFEPEELLARIVAHIKVKGLIEERERLYNQAELYFQSYKNSSDAIMITDANGDIIDINQAFTQIYGYTGEEVVNKNARILKSPYSTHELYKEMWSDILNPDKGYFSGEVINLTKDKKEIPVILSITPIKRGDNIIGYMGMTVDITLRKQFEDALKEYNRTLEQKVKERTKEIEDTQDATIIGLAKLAEYRDPETGAHLERIRNYCKLITEELGNMEKYKDLIDNRFIDMIYKSSPLHDIGKVGIPDSILLKPARLTAEEFEIMKRHTIIGGDAIAAAEQRLGSNTLSFLTMGKEIAYYHHEKFDGSGYPEGLKGDKISLPARIMALADVYDALTSKRVYKEAWIHDATREAIIKDSGKHFDPDVVDAFLKVEGEFIKIHKQY
jgi:PAS domain S-box-containing protein